MDLKREAAIWAAGAQQMKFNAWKHQLDSNLCLPEENTDRNTKECNRVMCHVSVCTLTVLL
jgi:hypothetical protein